MRSLLTAIFVLLMLWGCSTEKPVLLTESENGKTTLDSLLQAAPVTTIDLRGLPMDTLYAGPDNTLGPWEALSDSSYVRVDGMVKVGDSLYVASSWQNAIFVVDREGNIVRKVGGNGRGAGEFNGIHRRGLFRNDDWIFVNEISFPHEPGNERIQVLDQNLNTKAMLDYKEGVRGVRGVTDSLLYRFVRNRKYENWYHTFQAQPPFEQLGTFWPKLITSGSGPSGYRPNVGPRLATNTQGQIAIYHSPFPYIFILNRDHEIVRTLYLQLPEKMLWDNPLPESFPPLRYMDPHLVHDIQLSDDGSLYIAVVEYENTEKWHYRIYRLTRNGTEYQAGNSLDIIANSQRLSPRFLKEINDTLYVSWLSEISWFPME